MKRAGRLIVLYLSHYDEPDEARSLELARALRENLDNPYIGQVVLLSEPGAPAVDDPKAVVVPAATRPDYADFFELINSRTGVNDVSVLVNSDVAFDETAKLMRRVGRHEAYAISRHEVADGKPTLEVGPDSQDVWVFRGPVRAIAADYKMGTVGCDNRLAWELGNAGYVVSNPCLSVVARHYHLSGVRRYGTEVVPEPYDWVHHCKLQPRPNKARWM